jgi:hypothetical protein
MTHKQTNKSTVGDQTSSKTWQNELGKTWGQSTKNTKDEISTCNWSLLASTTTLRTCRVLLTQIYKAVLVQNSAFANHLSMVHPNEEKCSKLYHFHTLNRTDCNTAGNSEKRKHNGQPLSFDPNLNTHKREEVNEGQI